MKRFLIISVLTGLFSACSETGEHADGSNIHTAEYDGLLMETNVEHSDNKTDISIQVTNTTDDSETFVISDGHAFDIRLLDDEENVHYDFAEGRMFTQAVIAEELASKESYKWTETLSAETYLDKDITTVETTVRINEWRNDPVAEGELKLQKDWER